MTAILGISAFYHDAAAAIVVDGRIVAAAQEERFTRKKHDADYPAHAVDYCLQEAGLKPADLDYVGFYEKPLLKFERLLETYLAFAPVGLRSFAQAMPVWLKRKLHLPREMRRRLGGGYRKRFVFAEHHESHAASAFFPSPFEDAAILTADGVGEWATATLGVGEGRGVRLTHELHFPHSPGLLYSAFTQFCGFRVNSDEYKLMGLAPYGEPTFVDVILEHLIDLKPDGSFRLDQSYFNYCQGLSMTSRKFARLFGGRARQPDGPITQRDMDLAASIQKVVEEIVLRMARHVYAETNKKNLCMAGGVALNSVVNGRLLREGPFENIWVQPAAGDAGGALGVALLIWHQLLNKPRVGDPLDSQRGSLLGPRFDDTEVVAALDRHGAVYRRFNDDEELCRGVAWLIADGKIVGWMQDRMEFGPRALGARSILADARCDRMQAVMNERIKFRESFRPFAPSVLEERASEFFELQRQPAGPYMLLVAPVSDKKRIELNGQQRAATGLEKLNVKRSVIPAVTHVDYSARVQFVDAHRHGRYYKLLKSFEALTGTPLVVNTSFNVRDEPIVCTPDDAYRCFMATGMDVLVVEHFVLMKDEQPR